MEKYFFSIVIIISFFFSSAFGQDARDYFESGIAKVKLQDNKSAMLDFSKAIELDSTFINAYISRAELKEDNQDIQGAIHDYSRVILIDKANKDAYLRRGVLYYKLNLTEKACNDWEKARDLGLKAAKSFLKNYCEK